MLSKLVNSIFPCEKMIKNLREIHSDSAKKAIEASDRLLAACETGDAKVCIIAPYRGVDRRKS